MSIQLLSDNELVKMYMSGNEDALAVLVKRHKRRIFSYIYLITKNRTLTEDVFQETFFKVIQTLKRQQYSEEGKFLPWVLRISKNLIIDHFRKVKKMPSISKVTNEEGEEVNIFDIIPEPDLRKETEETRLFKQAIRAVINQLPTDQREVVVMRTYYDMSFKEIADITNVSINTSLGRMRYALINLKKMMENKEVLAYM
ncbi:MAG: sigma-70 family RNA polymerase sigma factor [Bacteroidia bacterium]|nr:sigma-70 family RNA polymerase sigma factor [Bacteroidia bacterium]